MLASRRSSELLTRSSTLSQASMGRSILYPDQTWSQLAVRNVFIGRHRFFADRWTRGPRETRLVGPEAPAGRGRIISEPR